MKLTYATAIFGATLALAARNDFHCYPIEEADEDWDEVMEFGRGHINDLDAINLGGGWALVSRAEVRGQGCHVIHDNTWYTTGKSLEDIKAHARSQGYDGFSMFVDHPSNYGQVFYKKCKHAWYGTVHTLEENEQTDFYLFREEDD